MAKISRLARLLPFLCLFAFCCSLVRAQSETSALANAEYGSIKEILPLHRVFVVTSDLNARDIIIKELAKNPKLEVVDRKERAEFVLGFEIQDQLTGATVLGNSVTSDRTYWGMLIAARGVSSGEGEQRVRILWHTQKRQAFNGGISLSRHPAVNATREFLKALKDAERKYGNEPAVVQNDGAASSSNSTPSNALPQKSEPSPTVYGVTLEGYNQLKTGMKYAEAVKMLGEDGVETSSGGSGRYKTEMYQWRSSTRRGVIIAMFQNGKLINKAQSGLW